MIVKIVVSAGLLKNRLFELLKIIKQRLMLLSTGLENQITRSMDRLRLQTAVLQPHELVSSFYYCSQLLCRYREETSPALLNQKYFHQFQLEIDAFVGKDFSKFKIHHKELVDEILQITQSLFINKAGPRNPLLSQEKIESDEPVLLNLPESIKKQASFYKNNNSPQIFHQANELSTNGSSQNLNQQTEGKQLYSNLMSAYKQHRIDEAYELKEKYAAKYSVDEEKKKIFDTIQLEYNTMISFYRQFDQDNWVLDKQQNGTRLEYKIFEEQKQVGVRVSAELDVPIDHFLAILTEIDLFEKYVPFCYGSRELKTVSRNQKIGTSKVFIPCLTDREVYFYAAGYDRIKKNGSVFLFSKTINDDKIYQQKYGFHVPELTDYVRLEYKFYIIEYIPVTLTKAKIRLAVKVDMKLNFLPQFIINMSARKFAFDYFKNIPKLSRKFEGSDWDKKVKENPEFYQFFAKKIDEYMSNK